MDWSDWLFDELEFVAKFVLLCLIVVAVIIVFWILMWKCVLVKFKILRDVFFPDSPDRRPRRSDSKNTAKRKVRRD